MCPAPQVRLEPPIFVTARMIAHLIAISALAGIPAIPARWVITKTAKISVLNVLKTAWPAPISTPVQLAQITTI